MGNQNMTGFSRAACLAVYGAFGAALLGGCAMSQSSYSHVPVDNKITIAETVERMELYVGPNGLNLSARDQDAVGNFIAQYSRAGQGPLYLNVPAGSSGAGQAQEMIGAYLANLGIGKNAIQTGQYAASAGVSAPLVVSYRRLATVPIECEQGADLTYTSHNTVYGNFGCTQAANLAAMIDGPRQLLAPYDLGPVPVNRRMKVLGNYANGKTTATPRPSGLTK